MTDSIVAAAIDDLDKTKFERFAQFAFQQIFQQNFTATGGMHDGGLDGYFHDLDENHFFQASKEQKANAKIRKTIRRLKKTRTINKLSYATSVKVTDKDKVEATIFRDTGIKTKIYDKDWFIIQCDLYDDLNGYLIRNSANAQRSVSAFNSTDEEHNDLNHISILTYMELEAASLDSAKNFNELCVDTVVYEALQGTDSAQDIFKSSDDIQCFISKNYPMLLTKTGVSYEARLEFLSSKENRPRIRKHPNDRYSLPYDVRNSFSEANIRS